MNLLPTVIETTSRGERAMDIHSRLLRDRTIMINGEIDNEMSDSITSQLLFLENNNPSRPIYMYINSPGGDVTAGMAIYDMMEYIQSSIHTIVIGQAASMASVIAQSGSAGERKIMPNARLMIHQPLGSVSGSVSDAEIVYKEMVHYKELIGHIYEKHNTKNHDKDFFLGLMDRDYYFGAEQAIELGMIDSIVTKRSEYGY